MMESEILPRKFIIPIIVLIFLALLIPVGNYLATPEEEVSEDIDFEKTIIVAIFALSLALAGLFVFAIVSNPPDFSNNDENEGKISFTSREKK